MAKVNRTLVIMVLLILLGMTVAAFVTSATVADQKSREVDFKSLEISLVSTLNAGGIILPLATQTPGIFEPTLTAVAALNTWKPLTKDFDGVLMVEVPAGCFYMGSDLLSSTRPVAQQCFATPFWIGQTEVTVAQFQQFVDDGGMSNADYWTDKGWRRLHDSRRKPRMPRTWSEVYFHVPSQPITGVSWYFTQPYMNWLTERYRKAGLITSDEMVRLPTEAEWEYAARGPDSLQYPWGNEWDGANIVIFTSRDQRPELVGSNPKDQSWVGAFDMGGNVWEWTSSIWMGGIYGSNYPYSTNKGHEDMNSDVSRVMRGGSFYNDGYEQIDYQSFVRLSSDSTAALWHNGFRIVIAHQTPSS